MGELPLRGRLTHCILDDRYHFRMSFWRGARGRAAGKANRIYRVLQCLAEVEARAEDRHIGCSGVRPSCQAMARRDGAAAAAGTFPWADCNFARIVAVIFALYLS
jgi:hypothetical protein